MVEPCGLGGRLVSILTSSKGVAKLWLQHEIKRIKNQLLYVNIKNKLFEKKSLISILEIFNFGFF